MKKLLILFLICLSFAAFASPGSGDFDCHEYFIPVPDNQPQVLSLEIPQSYFIGNPFKPLGDFVSVALGIQNPYEGHPNEVRVIRRITNYYPDIEGGAAPNGSTDDIGVFKSIWLFEKEKFAYPAHVNFVFSKTTPTTMKTPILDALICYAHNIQPGDKQALAKKHIIKITNFPLAS
jgi:hypothetical protein